MVCFNCFTFELPTAETFLLRSFDCLASLFYFDFLSFTNSKCVYFEISQHFLKIDCLYILTITVTFSNGYFVMRISTCVVICHTRHRPQKYVFFSLQFFKFCKFKKSVTDELLENSILMRIMHLDKCVISCVC